MNILKSIMHLLSGDLKGATARKILTFYKWFGITVTSILIGYIVISLLFLIPFKAIIITMVVIIIILLILQLFINAYLNKDN